MCFIFILMSFNKTIEVCLFCMWVWCVDVEWLMKPNPASACVCTACEKVSLSMCLGKDSGQQGTGWVQGRGRARRQRSGYSFSTRGVLLPCTYSVCRWGAQTPYTSPLHFLSFIPFWIHTHTHKHTPFLLSTLSPPTSLILSAGEWMVFGVNYVWLRDDGEWMGLWECESWARSWKSYRSLTSDQGTAVSNESLLVILSQSAEQLWGEEGGTGTGVWSVVCTLSGCRFMRVICL